jgi:protein-tyrosine phosphatase
MMTDVKALTLTDTHSHILPGIDDGARDAEMSRKMLEAEKKSGVGKILLTPHFYLKEQGTDSFLEKRAEAEAKLFPIADELGIKVKSGAEVLYTKSLADTDLTKLCFAGTRYMMIELPYRRLTDSFITEFRSFAGSIYPDILLILAHAERYLDFTSEESIYSVMDCDMLVQLNCGGFRPFSKRRKFMLGMIKNGLAQLLGTDCHNVTSRPPDMDTAQKAIRAKLPGGVFEKLADNADRVFGGEIIL